MEKSYLNQWLSEFPRLRFLLSKGDLDVLSKINPADYALHNLTRETEVIRIINDHKPQAWKWVRLFPNLQNLSAEDYAILDHIVTNDYIGEVTEQDILRIIAYRKDELRKKKEAEKAQKAKEYYQDNKAAIEKEERFRYKLSKAPIFFTTIGVAVVTPGVACINAGVNPIPYFLLGGALIIAPWLYGARKLKSLDKNSVIPRNKEEKVKMDITTILFIVCYYAGVIGLGILLGSLPTWERLGWYTAEQTMMTGFITIAASVIVFLIAVIATPVRE